MNMHQLQLWQSMIDLIKNYLSGKAQDFYDIVGKLEGALDAAEIKNTDLIQEWYNYWTPLEIRRAMQGNNVDINKAREELMLMLIFLRNETNK